ncbi:ATP-binding protein [Thermodesulfobacteriota bacterium]
MFDSLTVVVVICLYMVFLLVVARWAERLIASGKFPISNSVVYSFALAVYCTTWTYYGSVGSAAKSGFLFLSIYLGSTLAIALWGTVLRKLVRIKTAHHVTSIADLISARYDRSQAVAAVATVIAVVGVTPYVALQFRAIESTFAMIVKTGPESASWTGQLGGPVMAGVLVLFTVALGIRRLDPTERHPGMMVVLAVESFVKLFAFLAAGIFVAYFMYDGLGDIFERISTSQDAGLSQLGTLADTSPLKWSAYLILAASAIMFLPRQFHVAVVENLDEKHIKTAMWLFPLYMFLINIFTFPIAAGGLLQGSAVGNADTFVLGLPLHAGRKWLSMFVFIGGFSAATAMIMVSAIAMATMITNQLLLPIVGWFKWLGFLRRHLLLCRWMAATGFIAMGYLSERIVARPYMLLNIGIMSFAAVLQFAPAIVGGLFWKRGNKAGALLGLTAGFFTWAYTLLLPTIVRSGWISTSVLDKGPFGISWLNPEQLFGIVHLDPVTHTVFWSLFFNIGLYVVGSLSSEQSEEERSRAAQFVDILGEGALLSRAGRTDPKIDLNEKRTLIIEMLLQYFPVRKATEITDICITTAGLNQKERISISQLAELQGRIERTLTGSIGAAQAHRAIKETPIFSPAEGRELSEVYAEILADLRVSPVELKRKVDYYKEKEKLMSRHTADLEEKIREREEEIKQRELAEQNLKQAEAKYRSIFENAVEGIFQTTLVGRFLSVNSAMARMLGYDSPEELMIKVTDIKRQLYVNPEHRDNFITLLEEEEQITAFEAEYFRKDGGKMWASTNARRVRGEDGELRYLEGTFQDITLRKKAEGERAALEAQLRQSQKMEAIGQLAGGVAHDFNNLLTAMLGYSNLLFEQMPKGSSQSEKVLEISRAAERAADLTQQLLAFSRKQVLDVKVMDLNELISDVESMLRRLIGEDIELVTVLGDSIGSVRADPGQIQQIVMNLAVNARDAMSGGGKLTIETADELLDEYSARMYGEVVPGPYVVLTVSDTGKGMDAEIRVRIFDPFFTTKEKDAGTGLGLSTVYGIIKQHRGHVSVYSELKKGTTFRVFLPRETEEAAEALRKPPAGQRRPRGNETVLIVEDEEVVLELACEMLEMVGYKMLKAGTPAEALRISEHHDEPIDLLLTDVVLPQMDGRSLFHRLSRTRPETKVLYMSGYTDDAIVRHGVLERDVHFLQKPFTLDNLLGKIREVLDGQPEESE